MSVESENSEFVLKTAIKHAIENFQYDNARFLAERLVAFYPDNPEASYLLAKTHYLMGNKQYCLSLIDTTNQHGPSIILYGICCFDLQKYKQGEDSLRRWIDMHSETNALDVSSAYCILGKICKY